MAWAISGVLTPFMNGVFRTRIRRGETVDRRVEQVIDHAGRRAVPMGWFIMPGTQPADLAASLQAHGFRHDMDDPAMAVDLGTLPLQRPLPEGFDIVEVLDLATLEAWITAWGDSYGATAAHRTSRLAFRRGASFGPGARYRSFLVYLDGRPVATSELFLYDHVAAIFWVGTVPWARHRGLGTAITLAPLLEARRLGYQVGALTASSLGYGVYKRLGFKEMARIPVYVWEPDRARREAK
jgi:ribosomal protein S18 acetylase RimI-like enzyme